MKNVIIGPLPTHKNYYLKKLFRQSVTPCHIVFDIAERCNLKCAHCTYGSFHAATPELTVEQICDYFTPLAKSSHQRPYVSLTGADPLLKDNIGVFIDFLERHRFPWGLITNGTRTPADIMRRFAASKHLELLRVSLDGLKNNHEALRGAPGCYDKTVEFISQACSTKKMVRVLFTVTALNIDDIVPAGELAARLGCDEMQYTLISFCRTHEKQAYEEELRNIFHAQETVSRIVIKDERMLSPDIKKLWQQLSKAKQIPNIKVIVTPDLSLSELHDYFYAPRVARPIKCVFPWFGMRIDSTGTVYPCRVINLPVGDIASEPLTKIFNNPSFERFRSTYDRHCLSICSRCSYLNGKLNWSTLTARLRNKYY